MWDCRGNIIEMFIIAIRRCINRCYCCCRVAACPVRQLDPRGSDGKTEHRERLGLGECICQWHTKEDVRIHPRCVDITFWVMNDNVDDGNAMTWSQIQASCAKRHLRFFVGWRYLAVYTT